MRMQVQSLTLLSGLRIWHCCKLQMWPKFSVGCDWGVGFPSPGTSICSRHSHKITHTQIHTHTHTHTHLYIIPSLCVKFSVEPRFEQFFRASLIFLFPYLVLPRLSQKPTDFCKVVFHTVPFCSFPVLWT